MIWQRRWKRGDEEVKEGEEEQKVEKDEKPGNHGIGGKYAEEHYEAGRTWKEDPDL